jgi:DNA polymerase elongation subunit (family B)
MQVSDPAYHSGRLPARRRRRIPKPRGRLRTSSQVRNPFSVGDRVSYYITAGKGPSYGRARLASDWNQFSRDEDVRYYLKQLEDVAKLFDEFTPGRSRQGRLL